MPKTIQRDCLQAWRCLLGVHSRVTAAIERDLESAGVISLSWYDVLFALHEAPNKCLRMHELANAVVLSRSGLSRLVDRLDKAGLVERKPCPEDGRGQLAVLTLAGTMALRRAWPVYAEGIQAHFVRHLSPADARRMVKSLRTVLDNIG